MKKSLSLLVVVAIVGFLAYSQKTNILLALIKYKGSKVAVAEARDVPWQQGPLEAPVEVGERPPNIILIVADDLGYNDISTLGGGISRSDGSIFQTPGIDRLAAEGAVFNQSYSGASTCAPSRAMLMTGRYPTRTGFEFTPTPDSMESMVARIYNEMDNNLPPAIYDASINESKATYELQGLPATEITLAEVLKERGYYTAHIGKWHLGNDGNMGPHKQGFDDSLLMTNGLYLPEDDPTVVNAKLPFDPIDQFLWAALGFSNSFNSGSADQFEPARYMTDYWTDESVKVIQANKHRPFFLYLAHWGPHTPLQATREDYEAVGDIEPHRRRVYAAMIRAVDRSVSRILETLEEEGLADNTIVMFTSDNGGAGYVGLPESNSPFRGWKITMFEGGLRVPMFVKWPKQISAGKTVDTPVAHIDVMPTLAAAAGTATPKGVEIDGKNILPLLDDETNWPRKTLFWQNGHYQVVRHGDWKLQINDRPADGLQTWLFNLEKDPTEQNNVSSEHPEKVNELRQLLADHQASARGPLHKSAIQIPVMIDKTLAEKFEIGDEYIYTPN
ncbi:sulfatase-like hydrolase/transferase [Microbulbifer agarilyticus]|uniref:sulfatase-like hydrolase/transferase n=1 Tax=Microbulbifer agarilyticus TaxID=260552 RepID=UPI001CD3C8B6|nr:sulfatase-like hydrolase/transferase [Microbulbifer agarilyticus]MCA0900596.1 sulfatase-like hydrolase/transferase [Microbulbifer agarilyticus]